MNCTICGAQIPMGQPNCPNCGAMVQQQAQPMGQPVQPMQPMGGYQQPVQPVQPMGGYQQPMQPAQPMGGYQQPMQQAQPMGGYQQPMGQPQQMGGYQQPMGGYQQPMGGYKQPMGGGFNANAIIGALKGDIMKLIGLIGAFMIFISPFVTWLKVEFRGEKGSDGLFGIASGEDYGIFTLYGILLLLIGAVLILWDIADFVPAIANIKAKVANIPYLEIILCAVALVVVILAIAHGDLNESIELVNDWGGDASRGIGPAFGIIAVILAAAPRVLKMLGIKR